MGRGVGMKRITSVAAGLALAGTAAVAQQIVDRTFLFQPGDVVRLHSKGGSYPDIVSEVVRCHDYGDRLKYGCLMRERSPRAGREQDVWLDIYSPDFNEITLLSRGEPTVAGSGAATPSARIQSAPPSRTTSAPATLPAPGQCPGPIPEASRAPRFDAATARWAIYENYAALTRRGSVNGRPISVGVTFDSLVLGKSEPNAVLNDPGRGAYLKNTAAPRGTTLYSVASVYRVCERYADSTRIARYQARHVCFKDSSGVWACGIDGFPQRQSIQ